MPLRADKTNSYDSADKAFVGTLRELAKKGEDIAGSSAVTDNAHSKTSQATREILGYGLVLTNVRSRIVSNQITRLNIPVAVARFVWMMSASNRLADIAFYEPKVKGYTDDGVIVPGSSYGLRILQAHPGIDQLAGAIDRLKSDSSSRRAAIAIYQPTDTTRESNDIPCAFGLMYHVRGGQLHATTIMRSNNAHGLLPFNLFEFSLLAELVAAEVGVEIGTLHHLAGSMHYYEGPASKFIATVDKVKGGNPPPMDAMPRHPAPIGQVRKLIGLESEFRHGSEAISSLTIDEWVQKVQEALHPYWQQMAFCLLLAITAKRGDKGAHDKLLTMLTPALSKHISPLAGGSSNATPDPAGDILDGLFKPLAIDLASARRSQLEDQMLNHAVAYEKSQGKPLGAVVTLKLRERVFERLAARDGNVELSRREFEDALKHAMHETGN